MPIYYSDPILTFLVAAISTRHDPTPLVSYPDEVAKLFGIPQASGLDSEGLHLFLLFSFFSPLPWYTKAYQEFLTVFLTTEARSRHCFLNHQHYSIAAQQCLQYLYENSAFTSRRVNSSEPILIRWALRCLPALLDRSTETEELIQSARSMYFHWRVKVLPEDESPAKAAIARYLSRCTKTSQHTSRH